MDFLKDAKEKVNALDKRRIARALAGLNDNLPYVIDLLPLLWHYNSPHLPGFVPNAPDGIAQFQCKNVQTSRLAQFFPQFLAQFTAQGAAENPGVFAIDGLYIMGSFGSISQTCASDLDIWLCHRSDLNAAQRQLLQQKANLICHWAMSFNVEIHFYLMDQLRFCQGLTDPISPENSGSAQNMLLLEEFYRSAVRLAGKPLLWLHLDVKNEANYDNQVRKLVQQGKLNLADWVDFGGLNQLSAQEYFGAALWQLYKGIDSPYKSVLKILLLEIYAKEYPHTQLIAQQFKQDLLRDNVVSHHFDPYFAILEKITPYLTQLGELKRLNFVRSCFYVKVMEDFSRRGTRNWRTNYMQMMAQDWGWSTATIEELNQRPFWKIKRMKQSHDNVVNFLMMSYRHLIAFGRKNKFSSQIMPHEIALLSRKLYSAFEQLPDKVLLLNGRISQQLGEDHLTFIEVRGNKHAKDGWYLINQSPSHAMFSKQRVMEYSENLTKLIAWAYFNRLLNPHTELHLISQSVNFTTLRDFVADLRLAFPCCENLHNSELAQFDQQCALRELMIAINFTDDPTEQIEELRNQISPSDLFSFGALEQSLVGSIEVIYRNAWNEIHCLHFEGQNAILLALKVLSNKIYRGIAQPERLQVFCYSTHYTRDLRNLVSNLFQRCIHIQLNSLAPCDYPCLRVAGQNWQFFFEERGISLQPIQPAAPKTPQGARKNPGVLKSRKNTKRHYPAQIDSFASEGFLQFFFEDNADQTFNVYLLDEANRLEIYRHCVGEKDAKVREINQLYQSSNEQNPYNIVQKNFNYPQFYQLLTQNGQCQIVPFRFQSA